MSVCSCVSVYISAYVFLCVCMRVKNKHTSERFITGPVSALSLPEGNRVEMRDRKTCGRAPHIHCHMPVPSGGHTGHYDVFQMDTSVCFPRNKSAKSRGRNIHMSSLLFCSSHSSLPGCHDTVVWWGDTSWDPALNTTMSISEFCFHLLVKWQWILFQLWRWMYLTILYSLMLLNIFFTRCSLSSRL